LDESGAPFLISGQNQPQTLTFTKTRVAPGPVPTPDPKKNLNFTPIRFLFGFEARLGDKTLVTVFEPPLIITAKYNSDEAAQAKQKDKPLKLFQYDPETKTWIIIPTTVNADNQTLSGPLGNLIGKDPEGTGY
jgi:hypothetical protein